MLATKEGEIICNIDQILEYKQQSVYRYNNAPIKHEVYDSSDYCYILALKVRFITNV